MRKKRELMDYVDALKDIRVVAWAIGSFAAVIAFFVAWAVKAQMNISTLMTFKKEMLKKATPIMKPACLEAQENCKNAFLLELKSRDARTDALEKRMEEHSVTMTSNSTETKEMFKEAMKANSESMAIIIRHLEKNDN